jgi:hypothetical protein
MIRRGSFLTGKQLRGQSNVLLPNIRGASRILSRIRGFRRDSKGSAFSFNGKKALPCGSRRNGGRRGERS